MSRHFGIGIESTWNTPVAPTIFLEALSEQIRTERNFIDINTIRSEVTRKVEETFAVVRGTVEVVGNYQDIAILYYLLLGDVDTTGSGPYTHTVPGSTGIAARPSLTLEMRRDSDATTWRYAGCILTGITLNVTLNQEARLTVSFIGASEATGTAASATFPALDVVLPKHATVNFDAGAIPATEFTLAAEYPVDEPNILGSTVLGRQPQSNNVLAVTATATSLFEDAEMTSYNKFDGSTEVDVQLVADSGGDEVCTINLNKTKLTQATPAVDGRARLTTTYEARSYFDTTATANLQVVVTNDDAVVP